MMLLFGATVFLGAGLLFLVQPMVAKMVLPLYGGSPQVWNTSMVFFQAVLLAGYAATHLIARHTSPRRHAAVQLVILLLPLLALPIALPTFAAPPVDAPSPALWLLVVLGVAVALPFFVVTMTSPTLLRWLSTTDHPAAGDPYFLYAAGNVGSLLALIAYPFIVEPNLATTDQTRLWAGAYLVYAAMFVGCAYLTVRRSRLAAASPGRTATASEPDAAAQAQPSVERPAALAPVTTRRRLWWILLAFVPSSLMLGVTSYLTTDIAAVPLLWIIPLSVYLLTFIIAFSSRITVSPGLAGTVLAVVVAGIALTTLRIIAVPVIVEMALHVIGLFAAGLLAHGRLAADRPHPSRLTEYFLIISLGGVLGGIFNALIAPVVFEVVLEYVIAIVLALLLRHGLSPDDPVDPVASDSADAPRRGLRRFTWSLDFVVPLVLFIGTLVALVIAARLGDGDTTLTRIVLGVALALTILLTIRRPVRYALAIGALLAMAVLVGKPALYTDRTFFGLNRVTDEDGRHELAHGTTIHGGQWTDPARSGVPLAYYHPTGPVGQVFDAIEAGRGWTNVAVIGLGAGSMAAYGGPGQRMTFYEIDPAVATIASDPDLFTFLHDSGAEVRIVLGDGRLTIADAPAGGYDLIFMDAFSSDSPPVHLLTREAMRLYLDKLAPDGLIVFNVSNRYLDLATVVARQGVDAGLVGLVQFDRDLDEAPKGDKEPSQFVVLARDEAALEPVAANGRWQPIGDPPGRVWTDDYSDVMGALRAW